MKEEKAKAHRNNSRFAAESSSTDSSDSDDSRDEMDEFHATRHTMTHLGRMYYKDN